jgi:hypothetical protein
VLVPRRKIHEENFTWKVPALVFPLALHAQLPFLVVPIDDLQRITEGESVDIREREDYRSAGTARCSMSGRAANFKIGDRLFTIPLRNFEAVINGKAGKAAVFEGNG